MKSSTKGRSIKKLLNENLLSQTILWTQLLSIITVVASIAIVFKKFPAFSVQNIRYTSFAGLFVWLLADVTISTEVVPYQDAFHLILQSLSLSLLLTVFLIFIRKRKPVIFRYPRLTVYIPLLVPIAQFIVMDTKIMREIIFMSLQGVSIVVFTLLTAAYFKELNNKLLTIVGIVLLLWGFTFFWILQEHYIVFEWAWAATNSLGVLACIYSFSDLLLIMNETDKTGQ